MENCPSKENKERFIKILTNHTMLHEQILRFYSGFRRDSHPMAVMVGIVGALSSFYSEKIYDFSSTEGKWVAITRLLAKLTNNGLNGLQIFTWPTIYLSKK